MTIERAAEIMDPESKEKFYGESGKQEVFEAMRIAKLALEKRIKKTVHPFWTGNSAACPYCASAQFFVQRRWTEEQILRRVRPDA